MSLLKKTVAATLLEFRRQFFSDGEFGLEIEVEGSRLPFGRTEFWLSHADHSLRGESCEYVLSKPLSLDNVSKAIIALKEKFQEYGTVVNESPRTSVHVHRNVTSFMYQEVYTLATLYFLFENVLSRFAGEDRQGNMYCLQASDAEFLILQIVSAINREEYFGHIANDHIRYSGLNFKPIFTFGSLEFRSFRGSVNHDDIMQWIRIIDALVESSKTFNSPLEVVTFFAETPLLQFIERVFNKTPFFIEFMRRQPDLVDSIQRGYYYAFEIAYAPKPKSPWLTNIAKARAEITETPKRTRAEIMAALVANQHAGAAGGGGGARLAGLDEAMPVLNRDEWLRINMPFDAGPPPQQAQPAPRVARYQVAGQPPRPGRRNQPPLGLEDDMPNFRIDIDEEQP